MRLSLILSIVAASLRLSAAPFRDLSFDQADPGPVGFPIGHVSDLMPGWTLYTVAQLGSTNNGPDVLMSYNYDEPVVPNPDHAAIFRVQDRFANNPQITRYFSAPYMLSLQPSIIFGSGDALVNSIKVVQDASYEKGRFEFLDLKIPQ